jgi:hypothetical protein
LTAQQYLGGEIREIPGWHLAVQKLVPPIRKWPIEELFRKVKDHKLTIQAALSELQSHFVNNECIWKVQDHMVIVFSITDSLSFALQGNTHRPVAFLFNIGSLTLVKRLI